MLISKVICPIFGCFSSITQERLIFIVLIEGQLWMTVISSTVAFFHASFDLSVPDEINDMMTPRRAFEHLGTRVIVQIGRLLIYHFDLLM